MITCGVTVTELVVGCAEVDEVDVAPPLLTDDSPLASPVVAGAEDPDSDEGTIRIIIVSFARRRGVPDSMRTIGRITFLRECHTTGESILASQKRGRSILFYD